MRSQFHIFRPNAKHAWSRQPGFPQNCFILPIGNTSKQPFELSQKWKLKITDEIRNNNQNLLISFQHHKSNNECYKSPIFPPNILADRTNATHQNGQVVEFIICPNITKFTFTLTHSLEPSIMSPCSQNTYNPSANSPWALPRYKPLILFPGHVNLLNYILPKLISRFDNPYIITSTHIHHLPLPHDNREIGSHRYPIHPTFSGDVLHCDMLDISHSCQLPVACRTYRIPIPVEITGLQPTITTAETLTLSEARNRPSRHSPP